MKNFLSPIILIAFISSSTSSHSAQFIINNVINGIGDTLWANSNDTLMNGGVVAFGYFTDSNVNDVNIDSVAELLSAMGSNAIGFRVITEAIPGSLSGSLSGSYAGFAEQNSFTSIGSVTLTAPASQVDLLTRSLYSIITNASSLSAATSTNEFAVINVGSIGDDQNGSLEYNANPAGKSIILGSSGLIVGQNTSGQGIGNNPTVKMIPEVSTTLLGSLGVLCLLRRRRS